MMTLYSDPTCPLCHRTRFVIQEKALAVNILDITQQHWPEDIAASIPYGKSPVLVERDLILFDANIIINYFNERFLQNPLMPTDPASKAQVRLMLHRIDLDWYALWEALIGNKKGKMAKAKQTLREDLTILTPLFQATPFFMSQTMSILDCSLAPLLWRLPMLNIKLPAKAKAVEEYAERIFSRPTFQAGLSDEERAMR